MDDVEEGDDKEEDEKAEGKVESKETLEETKEVFERIKQRLMLELGHYMMVRSDIMGRYNQEMQRFDPSQPIRDALGKVFRLIGQLGASMAGTGLLALMEYSAFDKGDDVGTWIKQIQDALSQLSTALNADLQLSSK